MTILGDAAMLLGAVLVLVAAIGAHRFGDALSRLHAGGKASSLGILLLLIGAGVRSGSVAAGLELLLTGVLLLVTMPLATHVLVRSVHRRDRTSSRPTR